MTIPLAWRKQKTIVLPTWPTRGTVSWESWKLRHINSLAFSCLKYFGRTWWRINVQQLSSYHFESPSNRNYISLNQHPFAAKRVPSLKDLNAVHTHTSPKLQNQRASTSYLVTMPNILPKQHHSKWNIKQSVLERKKAGVCKVFYINVQPQASPFIAHFQSHSRYLQVNGFLSQHSTNDYILDRFGD